MTRFEQQIKNYEAQIRKLQKKLEQAKRRVNPRRSDK